MRESTRVIVILLLTLIAAPTSASVITFNVSYTDPGNWSSEAMAALEAAANTWGSMLEASFAGETIEIVADFGGTTGLAATKTNYKLSPYGVAVAVAMSSHHVGQDMSGGAPEFFMSFNANPTASGNPVNWYFGTDGLTPANEMDFFSVALHEMAHGLGWTSLIQADGTGTEFVGVGELYSRYDKFVWSATEGDWLINLPPATIAAELIGGNLFWGGPEGIAGNGGTMPELYAPPVFRAGSSVSHLDGVAFNGSLMEPIRVPGEAVHTLSDVEKGILGDHFWDFVADGVQLMADFNEDRAVDEVDLLIWQGNFGTWVGADMSDGDTNGDGDVDGHDFLIWQQEFGSTAAVLSANGAVPEPSAILLVVTVFIGFLMLKSTRAQSHVS